MSAYECKPLDTPVHRAVMLLAEKARQGKLVLCAGAGLSMAPNAALPSGKQLGGLLSARLAARLEGFVPPSDQGDLLAVADAAIEAIGGLEPLQYETLAIADFERASPNFGHRALALLLAEGAVAAVLLWNWDTCIERAAPEGERIEVGRSRRDMEQLQRPTLAKVHGCATRPETLLITSAQLADPPLWADETFQARLRGASVAFIGIGDVADYAKRRITELTGALPGLDISDIFVISPEIATGWDESVWAELLPDLDDSRRVEKKADELLDELARAWAFDALEEFRRLTATLEGHDAGVAGLAAALTRLCGADVIAALRAAAFRHRFGESVLRAPEAQQALVALAVLGTEADANPTLFTDGRCRIGTDEHTLLIAVEQVAAGDLRREAFRRAERLAGLGQVGDAASFLVSGVVVGPLDQPLGPDLADGEVDANDVYLGPRGVTVTFLRASEIVARAA
jgi:hypothetical protein